MAFARADRRVNVGVFVFAAVLLDFALWLFVLAGWESVTIPATFARTHQPEFVFPYSHGLLASMGWSAAAGAAIFLLYRRLQKGTARAAALVAAAVFSHWLLDALVHAPELPLAGITSMKVGLGLWHTMPIALAVEAFIAFVGLYFFLSGANLSRARTIALSGFSLLILGFTVVGMTIAPAPPSTSVMAASSLVSIIVACAVIGWLGAHVGPAERP